MKTCLEHTVQPRTRKVLITKLPSTEELQIPDDSDGGQLDRRKAHDNPARVEYEHGLVPWFSGFWSSGNGWSTLELRLLKTKARL